VIIENLVDMLSEIHLNYPNNKYKNKQHFSNNNNELYKYYNNTSNFFRK
jgi:hypothetical protein